MKQTNDDIENKKKKIKKSCTVDFRHFCNYHCSCIMVKIYEIFFLYFFFKDINPRTF